MFIHKLQHMKYLFCMIPLLMLFACDASKKVQGEAAIPEDQDFTEATVIAMSKGPCFGTCPVYDLTIKGNGEATLVAKKFMDYEGTFNRTLNQDEVDALIGAFLDANFFDFEEAYTANVTDLPTTWITFTHNGRTKKVKAYYDIPASLVRLIDQVHAIAIDKAWAPDK